MEFEILTPSSEHTQKPNWVSGDRAMRRAAERLAHS